MTLQESRTAGAIRGGGPYDSARNGMNSRVGKILEVVQGRQARIPHDVAPFDEARDGTYASSGDARFELRCTACGYGVVVRNCP